MLTYKECPFCGQLDKIIAETPEGFTYQCFNCSILTPAFDTELELNRFWNSRSDHLLKEKLQEPIMCKKCGETNFRRDY